MPVVLAFVHFYLPGFKSGGPVRTLANIVEHLGKDIAFKIVTCDRDSGDAEPYVQIRANQWHEVGNAQVLYSSADRLGWCGISEIIKSTPHDALYLNSFFDPIFSFKPLLIRHSGLLRRAPLIIAPRGELSKGALQIKAVRKRLYVAALKMTGVIRNAVWQASSEHEARDIREALGIGDGDIVIAPDLATGYPDVPEIQERAESSEFRIVFMSRIVPMKNLAFAIEAVQRARTRLVFDIYGTVNDACYWRQCMQAMKPENPNVTIRYRGVVPHEEVPNVLARYDLFFLPTMGENFGHAIYEAMANGLPVLISDRTPWRNLEDLGIGADLPLGDAEPFGVIIDRFARIKREEWAQKRAAARKYAARIANGNESKEATKRLFFDAFQRTTCAT